MVPIDDSKVRWEILSYIVGLIDEGHLEPLIAGGLTPEVLDTLQNRRLKDVAQVANDASIGFHIVVDAKRLSTAFLRLDAVMHDKMMLEYLVRHGTPPQLLTRLFKVSSQDLRRMREVLCPSDRDSAGRPGLPDVDLREAIHIAWADIQEATQDERERLRMLSQRYPDYSIRSLWTVINEFGDANLDQPSVPSKKALHVAFDTASKGVNASTKKPGPARR